MSTNIHIIAKRKILVLSTNKTDVQQIKFPVWQTPTTVTQQIMQKQDKICEYKRWVLSVSEDKVENIYAKEDSFCENKPIGTRVYNAGKEHIAEFEHWLSDCEKNGYDIQFEAW